MIPWDYDKIDEHYFFPPEEYRYNYTAVSDSGEEIVTHYFTDTNERIPHFNDTNYLFGYFNSD